MENNSKNICKLINYIGKEVGINYNLDKNSSFEDISEAFEDLRRRVDVTTRRKLQLEYKVYATSIQYNAQNERDKKISSRDLAGIIIDNEKNLSNNDYQKETESVLDFFNNKPIKETKIYKLVEDDRQVRETRALKSKLMKKIVVAVVILGTLSSVAVYSGSLIHEKEQAKEPTSIVEVASDYGEYDLVEYVIQSGDFSKEIIAKRLGTTPNQIEIVGELSKQAGDTITLKVFDRLAADNYNYTHKPEIDVEYDHYIEPGTSSLVMVARDMLDEYPLLDEYYSNYENPANKLASDLAKQSQNKGVISDISSFREGNVSIKLRITKEIADAYGIRGNIKS